MSDILQQSSNVRLTLITGPLSGPLAEFELWQVGPDFAILAEPHDMSEFTIGDLVIEVDGQRTEREVYIEQTGESTLSVEDIT